MVSDNHNLRLGIVDCSLYTRRFAVKDVYRKMKMDMHTFDGVECNYLGTVAIFFMIPVRQNQFIQENFFNNSRSLNPRRNDYKPFLHGIVH